MDVSALISPYWLQQGLNSLMLASLYVTLAVAYALLQGITNRIVLSFGDVASFGAIAAMGGAFWAMVKGYDGFPVLMIALLFCLAASAALGRASHAAVFGRIASQPGQAVMIASIGFSIVLRESLRLSTDSKDQWLPPLFDSGFTLWDGDFPVRIGVPQLTVIGAAACAVIVVLAVMRFTAAGRLWRAVAQNQQMALLCGVDTNKVFAWSFAAASALAGLSGWFVTVAYGGVSFAMGLVLGFKAMFAAIIGGFGRIEGAIAGGIFLAALETLWTALLPLAYRDLAAFGIIIFILVLKPEGLLGSAHRRDSEV